MQRCSKVKLEQLIENNWLSSNRSVFVTIFSSYIVGVKDFSARELTGNQDLAIHLGTPLMCCYKPNVTTQTKLNVQLIKLWKSNAI